jgi:hypothetical protein
VDDRKVGRHAIKAWKIVATSNKDGTPQREYYLVAMADQMAALTALRLRLPHLKNAFLDLVGFASPDLVEWLHVEDGDVLSIAKMASSAA